MNLNNSFLAVVLAVLGLFLTVVSLRLSSVIESTSNCMQSSSLMNSNRLVLIIGIVLFMSSAGYLLCKRSCQGDLSATSTSDLMYLSFNLVLGIVIIVLFSIIANQLKSCNAQLSGADSFLVAFGIIIGVSSTLLSLGVLGKKLYDNKEDASLKLSQMKLNALVNAQNLGNKLNTNAQNLSNKLVENMKASSPERLEINLPPPLKGPKRNNSHDRIDVPYVDPFGYKH